MNLLPPWVKWVVLAAIVFGAGWVTNGWRLGQQIAQIERDQATSAEAASEVARLKERSWNTQLEEARNAATQRETSLLADADRARTESERLRGDLASIRHQLPGLTDAAVRRYADTASVVLDECSRDYQSLAATADRIDSDRQTLEDAWPK